MNKEIVCISDLYKRVNSKIHGLYECYCGKIFSSIKDDVKRGHTKSCGCLSVNKHTLRLTIHGKRSSPEYSTWTNMKTRCNNSNNFKYKDYGARGIKVCPEWEQSFEAFYRDMGNKPGPEYSIDRIDNSKGYSKKNCRWATRKEQSNNQRTNNLISFRTKIQTLSQWAIELKIPMKTLWARLYKQQWTVERAFTTPSKK